MISRAVMAVMVVFMWKRTLKQTNPQ